MLDLHLLRERPDLVAQGLKKRGQVPALDELQALDAKRRALLVEIEGLKRKRNESSKEIGQIMKSGGDAAALRAEMKAVGEKVATLEAEGTKVEEALAELMKRLPNIPHSSVPEGATENDNAVVRTWGTPRKFDFTPQAHWDLGAALGILDFERAAKMTGARFALLTGPGARLERALINFMLDLHTREHGYTEVLPPFIVNAKSLFGTGQLPKFEEDLFKVEPGNYYLVPTAEVPVTNIHAEEILDADALPIAYCAYTPCFRSEAGSYGKDVRGLIRQHQFDKVELVRFAKPDDSYAALEQLTKDAEVVLQRLDLPHRTVALCGGDLGNASAKTYDIEVWLPSQNVYREISSCSNFEAYQARRANIKFRPKEGAKAEFVHTLNGSGLAVGRTLVAILENYQEADGSVTVPPKLRPFMDGMERIAPGRGGRVV
ncbi:MAG TPA: serine--tRNA ligase [Candidatus Polarisedimenticolaceae bacterium]|nr:serine--tRNA ligase [Candidatus Polarisedimenticolaceae bacterium]